MRPLELTIAGFRSYREPTTFDWRDRRLVGIVGPIGAGKSSILDAIAFALYGKTPGVAGATRSLIHQLCDEAHLSLTFQVDDQVWKAVRAPKRRGQSGHQLLHLAEDVPGAATLETVTQEGNVNARIESLLGMDFQAFCRSVLLAQNRFSDFLKATSAERDRVLKGVFGYERLDAAKQGAERRLDRETLALESLVRERRTIEEARLRLEDARERANVAAHAMKAFDDAAPEVQRLVEERSAADADVTAAGERIGGLERIATTMPPGDQLEEIVSAAAEARGLVEAAKAASDASEEGRAAADADLALVRERLGDRDQLRSFERLVERHEAQAQIVERTTEAAGRAEAGATEAGAMLEQRRSSAVDAAEEAARADDRLAEAAAATGAARDTLATARHRAMAHELRGTLVEGEPCPVCAQRITTLPARGRAPKEVKAAEAAVERAETGETASRDAKERAVAAVAAAEAAVAEGEQRHERAVGDVLTATRELRSAEADLAAAKELLVEALGEGEPGELVKAREAELTLAEGAAAAATSAVEVARRDHEAAREQAERTHGAVVGLANDIAAVWGALGTRRAIAPDPDDVRAAFVDAGERLVEGLREADADRTSAGGRVEAASAALAEVLASVGLTPTDDFVAERAGVGATHAAAIALVDELETQISRASDLEREVLEIEARRGLAQRLADDLKPAKFLAFLLQEERAELAELGSGLFETLTDGMYRFAGDDSFDIVDLNAADRTRKAESLSGGETFLASLALALALAEMVARGGGQLDAFFLDEGFGSLDPEHLDRAMDGIGRLVADDGERLVVLVSHVAEMREAVEDLVVLDKDDRTGDTIVLSGASPV